MVANTAIDSLLNRHGTGIQWLNRQRLDLADARATHMLHPIEHLLQRLVFEHVNQLVIVLHRGYHRAGYQYGEEWQAQQGHSYHAGKLVEQGAAQALEAVHTT